MKTCFGVLMMVFVTLSSAPLAWAKNSIEITRKSSTAAMENCDFGQLIERLELIPATFKPFGGEKSISTLLSKTFGMAFDIQITNCPLAIVEKSQVHYDSFAYITGTATNLKGFDETYSIYKAHFYSTLVFINDWPIELRIMLDLADTPLELSEKLFVTLGPVTLTGWGEIIGTNVPEPSTSFIWNMFFEMPEQPSGITLALIRLRPRIINGYDLEEIRKQTYNRLLREREKNCEEIYNDIYKDVLPRSEFECFADDM